MYTERKDDQRTGRRRKRRQKYSIEPHGIHVVESLRQAL
jgi:hypothetical protein